MSFKLATKKSVEFVVRIFRMKVSRRIKASDAPIPHKPIRK